MTIRVLTTKEKIILFLIKILNFKFDKDNNNCYYLLKIKI